MFLLMVLIGIGFGLLAYRNGALLESGTTTESGNEIRATVDGKAVNCYIAEDKK